MNLFDEMNKRQFKQAMKEVMSEQHIPNKDDIRTMIKEELAIQKTQQEEDEKKGIIPSVDALITEKKWKNIIWYILLFVLIGLTMVSGSTLLNISDVFGEHIKSWNWEGVNILGLLLFSLMAFIFTIIFTYLLAKVYDIVKAKNPKYGKMVALYMAIYYADSIFPNFSSWLSNLF